jgi:hypothetical protein
MTITEHEVETRVRNLGELIQWLMKSRASQTGLTWSCPTRRDDSRTILLDRRTE